MLPEQLIAEHGIVSLAIREKIIALVIRAGSHMDGAFDKVYARLLDPEFPLELLSPYQGADEKIYDAFRAWLQENAPERRQMRTGDTQ